MRLAIALLFLVIVVAPGFAQDDKQESAKASKPDFSGKWELDPMKSEFVRGMSTDKIREAIAKKEGTSKEDITFPDLLIDHRDPELSITERSSRSDRIIGEKLHFSDGRGESNTDIVEGNLASKTKWDGKKLVMTLFRVSDSGKETDTIIARISWELSKDGKTLTTRRSPVVPLGGWRTHTESIFAFMVAKMVYHRAQD